MKKRHFSSKYTIFSFFLLGLFLIGGCSTLRDKADFYGIKMRSETIAQDFSATAGEEDKAEYQYEPGKMDKEIYAYGYLEYVDFFGGKASSLRLRVINKSKDPIAVKRVFSTFTLVLTDGSRKEIEPGVSFYPGTQRLGPGREQTFAFSIGRLHINKEDIKMIICSFDLGETKVFLVPTQ